MPLILGTNSIKDTGYNVDNSLRFNDGSSDYLSRTQSAGNRKTWTYSVWIKRSQLGTNQNWGLTQEDAANNNAMPWTFNTSDKIDWYDYNAPSVSAQLITNRVFRDTSAWYHFVLAIDTTQATSSDRVKLYVNGVQETSFSSATYPSLNYDFNINVNTKLLSLGAYYTSSPSSFYDGYMSEINFIDGQQLDPTSFGEFDEDSGIWKPIDVSGLTFGTNGFYLDFEDSSALGNDVSGNDNDFTVNNLTAIDQSASTCTNNEATLNPLAIASNGQGTATLSNGNLTMTSAGSTQNSGTIAPSINSNSKWYYEFRCGSGATDIDSGVGWATDVSAFRSGTYATLNSLFLYTADGRLYGTSGWTSPSTAPTYTNGDIIGCTVDLENNEIKWYKNNSLAYTISSISFVGDVITPFSQWAQSGAIGDFNFGSPPFAISSGNTDGDGYGNFEYAVPSGYYALNTKNLAEYG